MSAQLKRKDREAGVVIAGDHPKEWDELLEKLADLGKQLSEGKLTIANGLDSHGIIGPQIDGCWRIDIELLLAPTTPASRTTPK